ncbi:Seed maturation protein [Corchorus olitorius]|uniref:Seed maturation protein n=2 Tax=Corchorus olitorius TaxID=93759 RepID=A0A1R3KDI0_9ROSI|nr:Seed maturation protein [Corchorus olitorius]
MSQSQQRRPQADQASDDIAIRYGDVFDVTGGLESKPIAPRDADTMRNTENQVLGLTPKEGAGVVMQAAANLNESAGVVRHNQGNEVVDREGVAVSTSRDARGRIVVTEAIADHLVEQYTIPSSNSQEIAHSPSPAPIGWDLEWATTPSPTTTPSVIDTSNVTIGEALEAAAITVGDKPVDQGDAAAIRTAEAKATGTNVSQLPGGGLGAAAQAAATFNDRVAYDYNKITISDVLTDAATKLPRDKGVTMEDAEGVRGAELNKKPDSMTTPGGVADTMATAARVNQDDRP